jgi:phosphatidate cytidylyltransferase
MGSRVVVGIGLVVLLIIAYAIGPKALVVLAALVIVASAAEACAMFQRSGFRPATLLILVATVGVVFGAYWKGVGALPIAVFLTFAGSMLWYVLGVVEARPVSNVGVTTMGFVWVGVLGSYASVMLRAHHGNGLFLGAVVVAVAADVAAFVVGRWVGSRPMAPAISPNKTVEGFIGGLVGAVIVGGIIGKEVAPWAGIKHGLLLGLSIGLIAPAGDLFESMVKRDLGIKDSGSVLAGHGGLLDRFDSILFALPTAYYVAFFFGLVH